MNPDKGPTPKLYLDVSHQYYLAYLRCMEKTTEVLDPPGIVCALFAAEVAMKGLGLHLGTYYKKVQNDDKDKINISRSSKKKNGHNLLDLFNFIPEKIRMNIIANTYIRYDVFMSYLNIIKDNYVEVRYFFEKPSIPIERGFIFKLLKETILIARFNINPPPLFSTSHDEIPCKADEKGMFNHDGEFIPTSKFYLDAALKYYLAYQRCMEHRPYPTGQIEILVVPALACALFSLELSFKALAVHHGHIFINPKKPSNKPARGHNLAHLFGQLSEEEQSRITSIAELPLDQFLSKLEEIKDQYNEWRYYFEKTHLSIDLGFVVNFLQSTMLSAVYHTVPPIKLNDKNYDNVGDAIKDILEWMDGKSSVEKPTKPSP